MKNRTSKSFLVGFSLIFLASNLGPQAFAIQPPPAGQSESERPVATVPAVPPQNPPQPQPAPPAPRPKPKPAPTPETQPTPERQPVPSPAPAAQREKPVALIKYSDDHCPSRESGIAMYCPPQATLVDSEGNRVDPAKDGIPTNLTDGEMEKKLGYRYENGDYSRNVGFTYLVKVWRDLTSGDAFLKNGRWMWRGNDNGRQCSGLEECRTIRDPEVPLRVNSMLVVLQSITTPEGKLKSWNELFPGFTVTELARPLDEQKRKGTQLLLSFIPINQPPATRVRPVPSRRFINYGVNHRPGRPSGVFTASNQDELVQELRRVVHPRLGVRKQLPPGKHAVIVASDGSSDSGLPVRSIVVKRIQSSQDSDGNVRWVVEVERRLDAKRTYRKRPMPVAVVTVDEVPPPTARIEVRYTERTL